MGASAAIIREARSGNITLLLTVALAMEYESVCKRTEHRDAAGLSAREVDIFVDAIIAMAQPVETYFLWRPQLRDANDEMVLEAAVNGKADILATFNRRHFGGIPERFGVSILLPRDVLRRLKQ